MADVPKLAEKAAELAAQGKLESAAEVYREILAADQGDVALRRKLAETLRLLGDQEAATAQYRQVALNYARDGLLPKAIAVCKVILQIDPGHTDTQQMLADLYASKRIGPATSASGASGVDGSPTVLPAASEEPEVRGERPLRPVPGHGGELIVPAPPAEGAATELLTEPDPAPGTEDDEDPSTAFEIIVETARLARAAGVEDVIVESGEPLLEPPGDVLATRVLPRIPLFSDLSPAAFRALTDRLNLRRPSAGEVVLHQGQPGSGLYVIASGMFRVERRRETGEPLVLAHLWDGAFFGEMALLSGAPRAASVIAETEGELLEIQADALIALCHQHPHVADSLVSFYRQRLLANAMATSPLFQPFDRDDRQAIAGRFRAREVAAGEQVITEDRPSDGLYVVLSGSFAVLKRKNAAEAPVGPLREGDVFGEMSCLRKTPAAATVVARRAGTVLRLPRADFDEFILTYPQILELVCDLADERQQTLEAIVEGRARWGDEGLILV